MKKFFKHKYLVMMVFFTSCLTFVLNKLIGHLINMKVLDHGVFKIKVKIPQLPVALPNSYLKAVIATTANKERPIFSMPYVPSWVAASFKDGFKHPVIESRFELLEKKNNFSDGYVEVVSSDEITDVNVVASNEEDK